MPPTKTVTIDKLIAEYAEPLATAVGIDLTDDDRTPHGFIQFLQAVADRLSPLDINRERLEEAARALDAIARLGDDGKKTQRLLNRVDRTLYEAREELELV